MTDRQLQVFESWDRRQRRLVRELITDELIEEHRRDPLGDHSDALRRVLTYFRRQPQAGKYVIVATRPWEEYAIAVLSGVRGEAPLLLEDEVFPTEREALHAVFERRVRDLFGT
jgi:branched-chain amino acid transport system permease protein